MLETLLIALLVVGALVLLATSWLSGRRHRDPSASVETFHRALSAMQQTTPNHRAATADEEHVHT